MTPTIKHLTLQKIEKQKAESEKRQWETFPGFDSGLANLNARRRVREIQSATATFQLVLALLAGALLFATIHLFVE